MESYLSYPPPFYNDPIDSAQVAWTPPQQIIPIDLNAPRTIIAQDYGCLKSGTEDVTSFFSNYDPNWASFLESSNPSAPPPPPTTAPTQTLDLGTTTLIHQSTWPSTEYYPPTQPPSLYLDTSSYPNPLPSYPLPISYPPPPLGFGRSPTTTASSPGPSSPYEPQSHWNISLARQSSSACSSSPSHASQPPLKRHTCQVCGRAFQRQTTLTQHQITHTGERPYGCPVAGCDKAFTTASNAKRHAKTHYRVSHHHSTSSLHR